MEDPATAWILHWQLATNPALGTWYWVFNECRETEFDKRHLLQELRRWIERQDSRQIADETIARDIECLVRTYVPSDPDKRLSREELLDCPLTELGVLRRAGGKDCYTLVRASHDSLSAEVFGWTLCRFWKRSGYGKKALNFEQVAFSPGSPGRVFLLSENGLVDRLAQLEDVTGGALSFGETAGLRQVYRRRDFDENKLLRNHYGMKGSRRRKHAAAQ